MEENGGGCPKWGVFIDESLLYIYKNHSNTYTKISLNMDTG